MDSLVVEKTCRIKRERTLTGASLAVIPLQLPWATFLVHVLFDDLFLPTARWQYLFKLPLIVQPAKGPVLLEGCHILFFRLQGQT